MKLAHIRHRKPSNATVLLNISGLLFYLPPYIEKIYLFIKLSIAKSQIKSFELYGILPYFVRFKWNFALAY